MKVITEEGKLIPFYKRKTNRQTNKLKQTVFKSQLLYLCNDGQTCIQIRGKRESVLTLNVLFLQ